MFNNRLINKFVVLGLFIVLLQIPLLALQSVLHGRQEMREQALESIAQSSSGPQMINGPYIAVPYSHTFQRVQINSVSGQPFTETVTLDHIAYILPERFNLTSSVSTQTRKRGIYEGQLFTSINDIDVQYKVPKEFGIKPESGEYQFGLAYLAMGITDIRGIEQNLKVQCNQAGLNFLPGTQLPWLGDGIHADLGEIKPEQILTCQLHMQLIGTQKLQFLPVGRETQVQMQSDWAHPNFIGNSLPQERDINEAGFTAHWASTYFSTNFGDGFFQCQEDKQCNLLANKAFGVNFMVPIDAYVMSGRAVEYAVLFIILTFAGCLLFEVLKKSAIHPVQYALISLALVMFYLLLLSLSEHLPFFGAYCISAIACVGLLGVYLAAVMQQALRGFLAAFGFAGLYGLLFGVLQSEDYALLLGSVVLFGFLALIMVLTRRLDWSSLSSPKIPFPKEVVFASGKTTLSTSLDNPDHT